MYAIANIIYGVPLMRDAGPKRSKLLDKMIEDELAGILTHYSGGGDQSPAAFGVELGEFDEACGYVDVDKLPLTASNLVRAKYTQMFDALSEEQKDEIRKYGEPRVHFLWSTS